MSRLNTVMQQFLKYTGFKNNRYYNWYVSIIRNVLSQNRLYNSNIHEKHHILPKAFDGLDSEENIAILTLREHFIVHSLLTRFTKGVDKAKMCWALHTFFHFHTHREDTYNINSRQYENHRKRLITAIKGLPGRPNNKKFRFKHMITNEEHIATRQEFIKISGLSSSEVYNITCGMLRHSKRWGVFDEDTQKFSFETPRKKSTMATQKVTCEYCGKETDRKNHGKWHGKNCKSHDPEKFSKQAYQITNLQRLRNGCVSAPYKS